MELPLYVHQLKRERRHLASANQQLKRSLLLQKQKNQSYEEQLKEQAKRIHELEKEKAQLLEELEKTKAERDTYKHLTFKEQRVCAFPAPHSTTGNTRGGQIGHKGTSRTTPEQIHQHIRVYLTQCPTCGSAVDRVEGVTLHTVMDLPHWTQLHPSTTQYQIERQWCGQCHKEVRGNPQGVIPGARLGMNLLTMVLVWKYRMREPLNKIAERLYTQYGISVSPGGLQLLLSRAKGWLGKRYHELITDVRGSPVKHADETCWPVGSDDWWAWVFTDPRTTLYTIEESRGGGVANDMLADAHGILVRDDYAGYKQLPLIQQSCWAHLLRKSHEASMREDASEEVKQLHNKLTTIFGILAEDVAQPFDQQERREWHSAYWQDVQTIITTNYDQAATRRIQTRIRNQGKQLLTALLYPNVPLTNNVAERAIMPLVITRKISRGSKTPTGAKIHAINMSIVETITKRKQPLLPTLQSTLQAFCPWTNQPVSSLYITAPCRTACISFSYLFVKYFFACFKTGVTQRNARREIG